LINIEAALTLLFAFLIAMASSFARADLSPADKTLVEKAYQTRQLNPKLLDDAIARLEQLDKESAGKPDDKVLGELARLFFFKADVLQNKADRIKGYQKSIDVADRALKINPTNLLANFWYAAAIGKQGLDVGITRSLNNAKPMKEKLDAAIQVDGKYEHGGPYRALGRLYYKLPGWPISFGDNDKAFEQLKKAYEVDPDFAWNKIYYAEILIKKGDKDKARKLLDEVFSAKKDELHPIDYDRWIIEARELQRKL